MPQSLLLLALWSVTGTAVAQSGCGPPEVRVWRNNEPVPRGGAPFARLVRVGVSPGPGCPTGVTYRFTEAEVTPFRYGRPLTPTKRVRQSTSNLGEIGQYVQPGDRIHVVIPYDKLVVVAADGKQTPYARPTGGTDEAQGISFDWMLVKP
ncbi:hypothetical protein [Hymenobacter terricola]|uniref:hypothetical protein n=1 Tax=Hymenobacter terricola TaxID=2819236 RepID=UPI001B309F77|nr:hypothetical protein [Hymenobacter terricola]